MQEVEQTNNDKIFIILTHQRKSIVYFFNDYEQLRLKHKNMKNNSFALYINQNLMECFLRLNYSHTFLSEQQCHEVNPVLPMLFLLFLY